MKKLWFFATFLSIFALFSDPSFARRGSVSPTPKVLTPSKVKPYQPKDFEKGKTNTQQKGINKTQLEKSKPTNKTQNPIYTNPLFRWLVGGLILGALLSLLLGHGFQVGTPGLLEIGLLALLGYFALRFILNSLRRHES
jgi:predicted lipid-binding transport protein (Tim44 family)